MTSLTAALVVEHSQYEQKIAELRRVADDAGGERPAELAEDLDRVLAFLECELLPHAAAEDAVLHPAVARAMGAPDSTATMRREHVEINRRIATLRRHREDLATSLLPAVWHEIRAELYGLHAILVLHVAKEEEIYVPLLERALDELAAVAVLDAMHAAVGPQRHD